MRIALITPGFSASEEDWCIPVLLNLVRGLSRQHDVHVFTLRYPHHDRTYRVGGATVHAFGGAETGGAGRLWLLQRALRTLLRAHRAEPFDVVHGFWSDEPGFLATVAGRLTRTSAIVSVMGGELVSLPDIGYGGQLGGLNPWLTRLALRGATSVTVGSHYLVTIARKHVDPGKTQALPLGVDTTLFAPAESDPVGKIALAGCPSLLSVGSLLPVKDHRLLLDALAGVTGDFPDAHLHLVGDGPLADELNRQARSNCVEGRVTFHGEVPHHELPAYYRAADLFLSSSRHESQCLAALEAAACCCPVLGTAVGILPEISPRSSSISPGNPDMLADEVKRFLHDATARRDESLTALRLVQSEYSLATTVDRLVGLYLSIAG